MIDIRLLGPGDGALLERVMPGVFDGPVVARWSGEFLADPRHHLVVALDAGLVVGMVSGVHYVHPDKGPELWINEVAVSSTHRSLGVGRQMLTTMLAHGRALGCTEAWVLTDPDNSAAQRLYERAGAVEYPGGCLMYTFPLLDAPPGQRLKD